MSVSYRRKAIPRILLVLLRLLLLGPSAAIGATELVHVAGAVGGVVREACIVPALGTHVIATIVIVHRRRRSHPVVVVARGVVALLLFASI